MMWTKHTHTRTHICRKHLLKCTVFHTVLYSVMGSNIWKLYGGEYIWQYSKVDKKKDNEESTKAKNSTQHNVEGHFLCFEWMDGRPNKSKCMKYYTSRTQYIYCTQIHLFRCECHLSSFKEDISITFRFSFIDWTTSSSSSSSLLVLLSPLLLLRSPPLNPGHISFFRSVPSNLSYVSTQVAWFPSFSLFLPAVPKTTTIFIPLTIMPTISRVFYMLFKYKKYNIRGTV